ncbi:MAG: proline iminopeptidase-family hydrolase [Candidatus Thermoplasmatota archaeon]|jgi:proline iminopeptidase|nr:proline iminopeptidase-family hydrolase [Candidatus Thermoplasmatota archaeon]MCL6003277.1 proline iminopeptidase-family hydrolase [Candidatus Thermoplasmatota archaeon]
MSSRVERKDGYVNVSGLNLYYEDFVPDHIEGTIICLHGGPGASHDYLLPLSDLSNFGFRIVLYDQFGCGKSDEQKDTSKFTFDYAVEEVEGVRKQLCPEGKVFLMGSSYGGALALAYSLKYQSALLGMIVSGGLASSRLTIKEMNRLIDDLPEWASSAIRKYDATGDYTHPDYLKATEEFYSRHLIRMNPVPREVRLSLEYAEKRNVYRIMNGPNEFTITGTIRDWDITDQIHKIVIPTLITVGEYDEVTEVVAQEIHKRIKGSIMKVLPNCSHLSMWEDREGYIATLKEFIDSVLSSAK